MSWIEGRKKSLQSSIKFTIKALAAQMGLVVLNAAGIAWNFYCAHKAAPGDSLFAFGFGMGAFTSNLLWTLGFVAKYYGEIKGEKAELKYITEIEIKEEIFNDREMYKNSSQVFESNIQHYKEQNEHLREKLAESEARYRLARNLKGEPTVSATINPEIQPTSCTGGY